MSRKKREKQKPDSWMPLFIGDFLADTSHLTTEQIGAYALLLMAMWRNGATLDPSEEELAAIARLPVERWQAHAPKLMRFLTPTAEGLLTQKRLAEEYAHAWDVYTKRVEAGQQGGRKPKAPADNQTDNRMVTQTDTQTDTQTGGRERTKRPPQSQPQPQPQPQACASNSTESGKASKGDTPAARVLMATAKTLAERGVECSTADPLLIDAVAEGLADALVALALSRPGKPLAYLVATARGKQADARDGKVEAPRPAPVDPRRARLAEAIEEQERAIYDARHLCGVLQTIDEAERDRRIAAAKARIAELVQEEQACA